MHMPLAKILRKRAFDCPRATIDFMVYKIYGATEYHDYHSRIASKSTPASI